MHLLYTVQQQYQPLHYMLGCAKRPLITVNEYSQLIALKHHKHYIIFIDPTVRGNLKCTEYVPLLSFRVLFVSSESLPHVAILSLEGINAGLAAYGATVPPFPPPTHKTHEFPHPYQRISCFISFFFHPPFFH